MAVSEIDLRWRARIDSAVDRSSAEIQRIREHLHAHPEPSGEEFETTAYLRSLFESDRYTLTPGPNGRGLIVEPRTPSQGPRVALRADIDALRIPDGKEVPYKSTRQGIAHACGHDGHAAAVVGAVRALDALEVPIAWRAIFQPAEETAKGALEMMEADALNGVDAIVAMHMDPSREAGVIGLRDQAFTADCVEIRFSIIGQGGHAARPHESRDPIATAAQLISSIYLFVPRATDSLDPVVVSIGEIRGGDAPNVIPDRVDLAGTMRTFSAAARRRTKDHIEQLCRGLAEASDTRIEIAYVDGPPAVINDTELNALFRREGEDLLGKDAVQDIAQPSMGGEDFANYLTLVPGAMIRLGCAPAGGQAEPLHSPRFDIDPAALTIGAKLLARVAAARAMR